jgi:hypothetical protein
MMLPLDPSVLVVVVKGKKCVIKIIIIVLSQDEHLNNVAIAHA